MKTEVLPAEVEAFLNAFKSLGGGDLSEQSAKHLAKAVKATMIEEKKSTVTITLGITKTNDEMISIDGSVKSTLPAKKISGAFFVDTQKYLPSRNRPDQKILDFKGK